MAEVPLLNAADDAAVAKAMAAYVHVLLTQSEQVLTHSQLDREGYLRAFARASVLREVSAKLDETYRRAFEP